MSIIPVSKIINVSITNTPSGLAERNVNSLALFTNEAPGNPDPYREYTSPAAVAEDYGTNSMTYQMANAIFAQTPNLRTGNGKLVTIPMIGAVSATSGKITTDDITANLAAIIAVTNGDIRVTVDGVAHNILALNFTQCETFADIAAVLQAALNDATVVSNGIGFVITSKKSGLTSTVALAAATGGTGTALNGAGYFNSVAATAVAGTNSSGETLLAAIARMGGVVSFTGVITNLNLEDAAITTISDGIQAQDRIFLHHQATPSAIAGIATTIKNSGNTKTRLLLHTNSVATANLMKAAYAGRAFSVNFRGSNTSQTMMLKQLATITPDTGINETLYEAAKIAGIDLYVSFDGVPGVLSTGGNDYFDNPYSDLALKFGLETAGFNFLRQTNTKVAQTEQGMNGLKSAYQDVLARFVRNGCVAPGSWTSSETFGDPEIFKQNVLNSGFYIYSLPIVQQDAAEREDRKAPLVQIAVKRAGAIHTSDVIVLVND